MSIIKNTLIWIFCVILGITSLVAQPADTPSTFCNPMNLNYRFMADAVDAREAADALILTFRGEYYLFASRSGGYWTSPDLRNWTLIVPNEVLNIEGYAPAVLAMRDTLWYVGSASSQIYKSGDPKSGVWELGPTMNSYGDPAWFLDDDDRLYMLHGLSNSTPTWIVEQDPYTFQEIGSEVVVVENQATVHGWERRGDDNLLDEIPWIEGAWMIKENGKYYYHYAAPGTEWKTYADGIYVADSPLGPYTYADYSPFTFKPTGFICGAGHGSTFRDLEGQYWHIGTMSISVDHMFERRLGLYPVDFDEDGHIHCNTEYGDYPQFYPGEVEDMIDNSFAGMLLLSHKKKVMASSSLANHGPENAVDEEVRTHWSAQTGNADEWFMVDLGEACNIEAIQVNFAEQGTDPAIVRGRDNLDIIYEQYTIETSLDGISWDLLVDKSQSLTDAPHDYVELQQPVNARYVKINNVFVPGNGKFALHGFRIFGNSAIATFTTANNVTVERDAADGRDAIIRWDPVADADGYIIRYGIAPDKLYNNYMVYDSDSVAMHSLNHGVEYYFDVEAFDSGTDSYVPAGEFRSSQSGNWNDVNTWAMHDGTGWVTPAPSAPDLNDGTITILDGHTVTVTVTDTADQLVVAEGGTLWINEGVTFMIENGISTDLTVEGTIMNYGALTSAAEAVISFVNNGQYYHRQNGGTLPTAEWRPASTCVIDSVHSTVPWNGNQDFYNIRWNSPDQIGPRSLTWRDNTIGGTITIENTGTGIWQMCAPREGSSVEVTIQGGIVQTGGQFTSNQTINANTTVTINVDGDINVTGGNFSVSRGSQGGTGTTTWNLKGNMSLSDATTQNSNIQGATFAFAGDGDPQTLTLTNVTYGGGGMPVEVDSGAVLDMGSSTLEGSGAFSLKAGATLLIGHPDGINASIANTGDRTFDEAANYGFNGQTAQVTGDQMPATVNNLIIDSEATVTLSSSVTVNGKVDMVNGGMNPGSGSLTYGPEASLEYSGSGSQVTADAEFPATGGPKNLIISNTRRTTLHDSRTITGNLTLYGDILTDVNTLTVASTSNANDRAYVDTRDGGTLQITSVGSTPVLFPVGTNGYCPVWITNQGAVDDIAVGAVLDRDDPDWGGRVTVLWNIEEGTEGGGDYTLQFGWMASLENSDFRRDRVENARIYNMIPVWEVGTGDYTRQLNVQPYTVSRGGITELGPFAVGGFKDPAGVDDAAGQLPKEFALHQNYPNPFNPVTTIDFSLPRAAKVKVVVYDILGKEMERLISEKLDAGNHSLKWNAGAYATGIYFYKIMADGFVQTRKMVLLK